MTPDDSPRRGFRADDRGVSIAITHVLAIGITTLLISALLLGAGGLLSDQQDRAAREELGTIGNRLATQIVKAQTLTEFDGDGDQRVVFFVDQPERISGGSYTVELDEDPGGDTCDGAAEPPGGTPPMCLILTPSNPDVDIDPVEVPVPLDSDAGDEDVALYQRGSGEFVVVVEDRPSSDPDDGPPAP